MRRALLCAALCLVGGTVASDEPLKNGGRGLGVPPAPEQSSVDAAKSVRVGRLGKPTEMEFEGVTSYRVSELQEALATDVKVVVAGHPLKPLDPFLHLIENRVIDGFRAGGFPEATATAEVADSRNNILVRVVEGPRFRCGDVTFSGLRELSREGLLECLIQKPEGTSKNSSTSADATWRLSFSSHAGLKPLPLAPKTWKPNRSVDFSEANQQRWDKAVSQACQLQGFYSPKFQIRFQPDLTTKMASLHVLFADEGPLATLRDVEFSGLQQNSRDEMLQFLGLQPGKPVRGITKDSLEQRLQQSGRFVKSKVQLDHVEDEPNVIRLRIAVRELKSAPKVNEELSRELQTVLKVPNWFEHWPEQQHDVSFRALSPAIAPIPASDNERVEPESKRYEAVGALSPSRGLVVLVHSINSQKQKLPEFALIFSSDRLSIWSPMQNQRFDVRGDDPRSEWFRQVCWKMSLEMSGANQPGESDQGRFSLGMGFRNRTRPKQPALGLDMKFAAVSAMGLWITKANESEWVNGSLVITGDQKRCRIDETTGQLLELRVGSETDGLIQIESGDGLFDRGVQEFDRASQSVANVYDPQVPWRSLTRFAIPWSVRAWQELEQAEQTGAAVKQVSGTTAESTRSVQKANARVYGNLAKLVSAGTNALLEEDWLKTREPVDDKPHFWIPVTSSPQPHPYDFSGPIALLIGQNLFSEMTWPWTLCRIHAFTVLDQINEAVSLAGTYEQSPRTGPLAAWVAARYANFVVPEWRPMLADFGLTRLYPESFRWDIDDLLAEGSRLRPASIEMAQQLRALSDDEARQVLELVFGNEVIQPLWPKLQQILRDQKTANETLLPELLDQLWKPLIRPWLEREFKAMQDGWHIRTSSVLRHPRAEPRPS